MQESDKEIDLAKFLSENKNNNLNKNLDVEKFLPNSTNKDVLERNRENISSDFIKLTFDEMLKFQSNLPSNSKAPENLEENSSDYNNDSDSLISSPPSPEKVNQFTLNINGNEKNDTPQNFSDDSNGLNDENVQNEIAAEQNDENIEGVTNVEEEMNEQQEIDQENKRKLQISEEEKIIFEQNELKKENSIKGNVWACILSSLGFAIVYGAIIVVVGFELGETLIFVALGVAAAAFMLISEINAIKIADKNMENIKAQDKEGYMEQKSPVKNICAAIFSGVGGLGLFCGFTAMGLIFAEEILPLFAVALISFAFCACAMALLNVAFYNGEKAANIMIDNYFLKNAKKEKEQEKNKENEKEKGENQEENVEGKTNENEVNQNQETAQQQTTGNPSIFPSNTGNGEPVPPQEPASVVNPNKENGNN